MKRDRMHDPRRIAPCQPHLADSDRARLSFDWSKMVLTVEEIAQLERAQLMLSPLFGPGALNRRRES